MAAVFCFVFNFHYDSFAAFTPTLQQINLSIYRFYYVTKLMFVLGYYQRHSWPYNPVHTCILKCLYTLSLIHI